jgi:hypothetical protein
LEKRAARVVATALDVLAHCAVEPAGTPPSFRVLANTRRRALRAAIRDRTEPVVLIDDFSDFEDASEPDAANWDEEGRLEELVEWVRERGRLRDEAARLVVLTRAGGVSVDELAAVTHVHPQTMRQQRLRAEQRLRRSLVPGSMRTSKGYMGKVMADGGTGDLEGIAWAYDELFRHELPAAISRDFTADTPPGSMMGRAVTATADALADLFVDLVERWDHLDEFDRSSTWSSSSTSSANWSI